MTKNRNENFFLQLKIFNYLYFYLFWLEKK